MREYRWKIAVFETGEDQFGPKFQVEGDVDPPPTILRVRKLDEWIFLYNFVLTSVL